MGLKANYWDWYNSLFFINCFNFKDSNSNILGHPIYNKQSTIENPKTEKSYF